jgi:hypothetical protein
MKRLALGAPLLLSMTLAHAPAFAQEKLTVWWNKGYYKAEDAALLAGGLSVQLDKALLREGDALVQHRPDRYGGVDYNSLIAPLVLSVQQQDSEVQALRARVAALESQLAA